MTFFKYALIAAFSFSPLQLVSADEPAKPEKVEPADEAKVVELTGDVVKAGEKFKFKSTEGKTYLITKNNNDKVKAFAGKKVKVVAKAKSKKGNDGGMFHMLVYVKSIEEAAAE